MQINVIQEFTLSLTHQEATKLHDALDEMAYEMDALGMRFPDAAKDLHSLLRVALGLDEN